MAFYQYKDTQGMWRWHLTNASNRIVAVSSESYSTKADCLASILLVQRISEGYPEISEKGCSPDLKPPSTLSIFFCYSSSDKAIVKTLCRRLRADGMNPWIDEDSLLPGQDWNQEIRKAVHNCDVVIVCISHRSINKTGYVQKEIRYALDAADERPDGTIFLIPLRLEDCKIPERLERWHWVNFFEEEGYEKLIGSLQFRAKQLGKITPLNKST